MALYYCLYGSHSAMLEAQQVRVPWTDEGMRWITRLGEFYIILPVAVTLWFMQGKGQKANAGQLAILYSLLLGITLPQLTKLAFADSPRPWAVFPEVQDFPGLVKAYYKSFPSGHTAAAVAWTSLWASIAKPALRKPMLMVLFAFGVGMSRIHLHMHWLHDVIAGGLLGLFSSAMGLRFAGYSQTT
jgi:membrane-associated phospholipid phosphatase